MRANNVARLELELVETNAVIREPIGIGACLAHLRLALAPVRSDLGLANDWPETPPIVERCMSADHDTDCDILPGGLFEHSCDICNYRYDIDRSAI